MSLIKDNISITGEVFMSVYDENNNTLEEKHIPNLIVASGKNHFASRIAGIPTTGEGAAISHIGIGTGTSIPISSNVSLQSPLGSRQPITSLTHTSGTSIVQVTATFTGYQGNITEAGIFNSLTGNYMICRTTFGSVPVLSSYTLAITWLITIN